MAIQSRAEFKDNCLRALGAPVINIDVTDEQISDRIDDALEMFAEYHFSGTNHVFYKHQVTEEDKVNKYITLPDNVLGTVRVFPMHGLAYTGGDMFDIRYQIVLNDLHQLTHTSMLPYVMTMTHLNAMQELLVGMIPIRYNKMDQKLHLDMDWDRVVVGHYLVVECFQVVDPEEYNKVWNEIWLKRYTRELIKRQWGSNLSKFVNMTLPGGIVMNGSEIYLQANQEIEKLEQELEDKYFNPVLDRMA